ncbi:MAG TPA: enoyl-CoA hydratase-related protein, partial [Anaeromyxobacteraceae bacterium]
MRVSRRGAVAVVVLASPPVNALGTALSAALGAAVEAAAADPAVRVLHLRSELRSFCAGADLAEMRERLGDPARVEAQVAAVRELQR